MDSLTKLQKILKTGDENNYQLFFSLAESCGLNLRETVSFFIRNVPFFVTCDVDYWRRVNMGMTPQPSDSKKTYQYIYRGSEVYIELLYEKYTIYTTIDYGGNNLKFKKRIRNVIVGFFVNFTTEYDYVEKFYYTKFIPELLKRINLWRF